MKNFLNLLVSAQGEVEQILNWYQHQLTKEQRISRLEQANSKTLELIPKITHQIALKEEQIHFMNEIIQLVCPELFRVELLAEKEGERFLNILFKFLQQALERIIGINTPCETIPDEENSPEFLSLQSIRKEIGEMKEKK